MTSSSVISSFVFDSIACTTFHFTVTWLLGGDAVVVQAEKCFSEMYHYSTIIYLLLLFYLSHDNVQHELHNVDDYRQTRRKKKTKRK